MMVLVSGATSTMRRIRDPRLGRLLRPGNGNGPDELPWAADNGAFSGFDEAGFLRMLERLSGKPGCLWVTAPDVVADARKTSELFSEWGPRIRSVGFPVAYVVQDGQEADPNWEDFDCLFVGGTTRWKLGRRALELVKSARRRNKLVHMGRVNSVRRLRYAYDIGCNSVDGTKWSKYPDTWIPWLLNQLDRIETQTILPEFYSS